MLAGWLEGGMAADDVLVVEPAPALAKDVQARHGVIVVPSPDAIGSGFKPATIVFAVKPQMMEETVPGYVDLARGALVLSIAAGTTIGFFEARLGRSSAVVRAMPNTPAAVGRGITALVANSHVTAGQRAAAQALLDAVGETVWLDEEGLMDAVTAVSGGGPAYVFLLIETLAKAGIASGLPADVAARLAHVTVSGAGELARLADDPPETLRKNVTSPGGTTLEALNVLMAQDGIQELFDRAVAAATRRSRELAG